jgi:hypothetical protein
MPTPTRVPNKVQWCIRDILFATREATKPFGVIEFELKRRRDPRMIEALLNLYKCLAEIERKALLAREGRYEE